jgi:predicted DNA-binding transcriptional regulator YafY
MRANRLLSILLLLQTHGRLTGRELARRLEVSERTLHRDMDALSTAGVPIYAMRGSRGGWQLDEGWRTQVPGLDKAELHALLMAQPSIIGDVRLAAAAERALDKLMAALPGSMREQANSIRQRLYVDTTAWGGNRENLSMLPVVQDAVSRDRKLTFCYQKANGERSERKVDPLGLVAKGNTWYLVARTADRFRTYRVSRMEDAKLLPEASERPADFDLAAYWKSSTKAFQEERTQYYATLRVEARAARIMKTWQMISTVDGDEVTHMEGWITLRVHFAHEEEACFVVLGFGHRIEVIEPQSLCHRVRAELVTMMKRHQLI